MALTEACKYRDPSGLCLLDQAILKTVPRLNGDGKLTKPVLPQVLSERDARDFFANQVVTFADPNDKNLRYHARRTAQGLYVCNLDPTLVRSNKDYTRYSQQLEGCIGTLLPLNMSNADLVLRQATVKFGEIYELPQGYRMVEDPLEEIARDKKLPLRWVVFDPGLPGQPCFGARTVVGEVVGDHILEEFYAPRTVVDQVGVKELSGWVKSSLKRPDDVLKNLKRWANTRPSRTESCWD